MFNRDGDTVMMVMILKKVMRQRGAYGDDGGDGECWHGDGVGEDGNCAERGSQ